MDGPLAGSRLELPSAGAASEHAAGLLQRLGSTVRIAGASDLDTTPDRDAIADWAESGAMWLTGPAQGPPLVAPGRPASAARGASLAIETVTAAAAGLRRVAVDGALLLGERAALSGLGRMGDVSPGGSCRLVRAHDGLVAVNLARPDDIDMVPAWLELGALPRDVWEAVVRGCASRPAAALAERAELLGIPVALVPPASAARLRVPWRLSRLHRRGAPGTREPGIVVDLSSMWAGPLCANLLGLAGFEVVKVESTTRPDGARRGDARMFDLLHGGHRNVSVDFGDRVALERLRRLIDAADVVIESSRPRALEQLGLGPGRILAEAPGTIWVSITGYGRGRGGRGRVAFGDDAGAAAGLVARHGAGEVSFCGDAIADPLTGLHAALVAASMWTAGCGGLVDVAMRDVVASTLTGRRRSSPAPAAVQDPDDRWRVRAGSGMIEVARPVARPVQASAAAQGADDDLLLR